MITRNGISSFIVAAGMLLIGAAKLCLTTNTDFAFVFLVSGLLVVCIGVRLSLATSFKYRLVIVGGRNFNRSWWFDKYYDNPHQAKVEVLRFRAVLMTFVSAALFFLLAKLFEPLGGITYALLYISYLLTAFAVLLIVLWVTSQLEFIKYNRRRNSQD